MTCNGYTRITEGYGVELVDLDAHPAKKDKNALVGVYREIFLPEYLEEGRTWRKADLSQCDPFQVAPQKGLKEGFHQPSRKAMAGRQAQAEMPQGKGLLGRGD